MDKFIRLTAVACPLDVANLNTDQLIPARFLKLPRSAGLATALLRDLRFDANGRERPDFSLNRPAWRDAKIIVGGRNFGCGSSREAAVYALYDYGIRCVIAPSFGDIFAGNAVQNGLLTAIVSDDEAATLMGLLREKPGQARPESGISPGLRECVRHRLAGRDQGLRNVSSAESSETTGHFGPKWVGTFSRNGMPAFSITLFQRSTPPIESLM